MHTKRELIDASLEYARPFDSVADLSRLVSRIGEAKIVMLGEASHGTHEFYEWRTRISQQLIEKHGFRLIAVEGDWPPCQDLNHYIHDEPLASGAYARAARAALLSFNRWPTWMWANAEIMRLAEWMRFYNLAQPPERQIGFHGLDVYSLFESIDVVLKQLQRINPFLASRARNHYSCFDRFHGDERSYARSLMSFPEGCEQEVARILTDLLSARGAQPDLLFDATQNARIVKNAEDYYRTMMLGTEDSWNVRDRHMMETLELLLERYGDDAKAIVWEHNTHIGDYRATDMAKIGQVNIGGLARMRYGAGDVALVGFGTHQGTVIASHSWDGPIQALDVPPGREGSYEEAFHEICLTLRWPRFSMLFDEHSRRGPLASIRGHRAIGVVYDPAHERWGNYVPTSLANRYDAFIFFDRTRALEPLADQGFLREEIPETWPAGQ